MVKHNNVLPNVHLRKHMQRFVKTWFNQPARKHRRAITRQDKAVRIFPRPLEKLRPVVHSCTKKYNSKLRYGRGFTLQEIKAAGLTKQFAQTIGIAPGIVVGRLQKDSLLPWESPLNLLKIKYQWANGE